MADPYVRRIHNALVSTGAIVYGTFPSSADTVAAAAVTLTAAAGAWTLGAWVEIVAAAGVTAPNQITGINLLNYVMAPATQGEIQIGTGAGGAEVEIARFNIDQPFIDLQSSPLNIPTSTRIAARIRTSDAVANTIGVKLQRRTGF